MASDDARRRASRSADRGYYLMVTKPAEASSLMERVGDGERDECISVLNGHRAQGRLSAGELDRRQDLALAAVTRYDLLTLVADLPSAVSVSTASSAPSSLASLELWSATTKKVAVGLLSTTPVILSAWLSVGLWEWDNAGAFYGALVGGAAGYGTYAGKARLRALLRRQKS